MVGYVYLTRTVATLPLTTHPASWAGHSDKHTLLSVHSQKSTIPCGKRHAIERYAIERYAIERYAIEMYVELVFA